MANLSENECTFLCCRRFSVNPVLPAALVVDATHEDSDTKQANKQKRKSAWRSLAFAIATYLSFLTIKSRVVCDILDYIS